MVSTISFQHEVQKLPLPATEKWPHGVFDIECFKHGAMSVILYTPRIHDYQTPHEQDEVYNVYKGTGQLNTENGTFAFVEGDVLFVPAWTGTGLRISPMTCHCGWYFAGRRAWGVDVPKIVHGLSSNRTASQTAYFPNRY